MTKLLAALPLWQRYVIALQRHNPYKWYLYYRTMDFNSHKEVEQPQETSEVTDAASNSTCD